jgi:hypothetical protein
MSHPVAVRVALGMFALLVMGQSCEPVSPLIRVISHTDGDFVTGANVTVQGFFRHVRADANTEVTVNGVVWKATRARAGIWSSSFARQTYDAPRT